jgi:hypothetical protein
MILIDFKMQPEGNKMQCNKLPLVGFKNNDSKWVVIGSLNSRIMGTRLRMVNDDVNGCYSLQGFD